MKLYHTSSQIVINPDTLHSRLFLDFGQGFYLTSIVEQAQKYGLRFKRRKREAWLNSYDFEYGLSDWKVKTFDSYNHEWLEFISKCRIGQDESDYDMVVGGIADDIVMQTLDRYFEGEISADIALGLLKYIKPNIQYCIRSQAMLDKCLKHIESTKL